MKKAVTQRPHERYTTEYAEDRRSNPKETKPVSRGDATARRKTLSENFHPPPQTLGFPTDSLNSCPFALPGRSVLLQI